ncbi:hypothetical protein V2G26_003064 [Clonostachys chloroleuca]
MCAIAHRPASTWLHVLLGQPLKPILSSDQLLLDLVLGERVQSKKPRFVLAHRIASHRTLRPWALAAFHPPVVLVVPTLFWAGQPTGDDDNHT